MFKAQRKHVADAGHAASQAASVDFTAKTFPLLKSSQMKVTWRGTTVGVPGPLAWSSGAGCSDGHRGTA